MVKQSMPNVDFRRIPSELTGLWVVVLLGNDQEIVGQGESPEEAMRQSKIDPSDLRYALTQVPDSRLGAAWIKYPARTERLAWPFRVSRSVPTSLVLPREDVRTRASLG